VVLMGLAAAGEISALLIERGWSTTTPAAVVRGASTAEAETWSGTLANLAGGVEESGGDRPGTIVIGEVVRIGALLAAVDADDEDAQAMNFGR
jgi:uroporphyrin-III C-methyltransferase/precorrin-2 dehydrogenase/sirohydrochlorin ferrochelatase